MRQAVALLMMVLVMGSATGAFAAVAEEASCEDCSEEDTGCCPPVCPQCVCIARGMTAEVPVVGAVPPQPEGRVVTCDGEDAAAPESAGPDEIFHVPIAAG